MAPTLLTLGFLIHSFTSVASSASLSHERLHNLHHRSLAARAVAPPTGWETKGCYSDNSNSRTLYALSTANDTMSTEACIGFCAASGYPLAGTEYGRECYCGNNIAASGSVLASSSCSFPCSGNSSEICGGNSAINIYHNISNVASAQPPATNAGPLGWGFLGCYVDNVNSRTLPYGATTLGGAGNMTVANCVTACKQQNYQYAGVEYSGECYCGSSLPDSFLAPDGMVGCSRTCNGNTTEYCGGANRLDAYGFGNRSTIAPRWAPVGCYSDSTANRTLRYNEQVPGGYTNMTIPACTAACQAAGYTLAGLEYSQECWCDNAFEGQGAPESDGCNMACKGDGSTLCGGSNRLNVYEDTYAGSSVTISTTTASPSTSSSTAMTTASSTIPSAAASTTTTATSATVTSTATIGNWTYAGCYVDNAYGRILEYNPGNPNDLTIESCVSTCRGLGYSVAGAEYSTQCFCGDAIINGAELASSDSQCNMACGGNSSEYCGAGNRMSIYSSSTNITFYPVPIAMNTSLPMNWTYGGCLSELNGGRVFSHFIDAPSNNSVTNCLTACAAYGYSAAGLEYGEQCFCGDDWDRINAGVGWLAPSACSMSCPGDPNHLCGGPNALSYYTSTNVPQWGQAYGNAAGEYDFLIGGLVIPLISQIGVNGKVVMTEKFGTGPPNSTGSYELDVSLVPQGIEASWRALTGIKTDVFCSAGLTLPDKAGRIINIGGWSGESTYGVRFYIPDGSPGVNSTNEWQENYQEVALQKGRWYPSAMQLVNGSILILGGEDGSNGAPVPSLEVLPTPPGGYAPYMDWLDRTDPNNLYPYAAVLPSGNIGVFYYNEARVLSPVDFSTIYSLPNIPGSVENPKGGRTYPLEGTAMLLPQAAPYTAPLQVLICGGSTPYEGLALDNCVTITPDNPNSTWSIERMPDVRVITCMTSLPDGTYLILNGAHQGQAGFGLASDPAHMAMLYDPTKPFNQRFTRMANTTIDRLYHSEAILHLDGRVIVSGSDPEDGVHPQEYRVETFTPPYLMGNRTATRPVFSLNNVTDWSYGGTYTLSINYIQGAVGKISLMRAVASTHGNSMGQRTIFPAYSCSGSTCSVTAPPNGNIAGGPGWWMVFVLDSNGTPSVAEWVRIGGDPAGLGNWPNFSDFTLPGV